MTKNLGVLLLAIVFALVLNLNKSFADSSLELGIFVGASVPNDKISSFYDNNTIALQKKDGTGVIDTLADLARQSLDYGYHIQIRLQSELSDKISFVGGFGINRFPEFETKIFDPKDSTKLVGSIATTMNIIPISAGLKLEALDLSFLRIYALGELSYSYISYSNDIKLTSYTIPNPPASSESRVGAGLGAGFEFDLKLVTACIEAKYNFANLVGKSEGEADKKYLTISAGIVF